MPLKPDVEQISREAGNSVCILQKHYLHYLAFRGVTRKDARAWFAIRPPPKASKSVPLQELTAHASSNWVTAWKMSPQVVPKMPTMQEIKGKNGAHCRD